MVQINGEFTCWQAIQSTSNVMEVTVNTWYIYLIVCSLVCTLYHFKFVLYLSEVCDHTKSLIGSAWVNCLPSNVKFNQLNVESRLVVACSIGLAVTRITSYQDVFLYGCI